jgi:hypothetical protein
MNKINSELFLEQNANSKILQNVTKYCARCYKEFKKDEVIYFDTQNISYLCFECACCISEELQTHSECELLECESASLF